MAEQGKEPAYYVVGSIVEMYKKDEKAYYKVKVEKVGKGTGYNVRYLDVRGSDGRLKKEDEVSADSLRPLYVDEEEELNVGCSVEYNKDCVWRRGVVEFVGGNGSFFKVRAEEKKEKNKKTPLIHISDKNNLRVHREIIGGHWYKSTPIGSLKKV